MDLVEYFGYVNGMKIDLRKKYQSAKLSEEYERSERDIERILDMVEKALLIIYPYLTSAYTVKVRLFIKHINSYIVVPRDNPQRGNMPIDYVIPSVELLQGEKISEALLRLVKTEIPYIGFTTKGYIGVTKTMTCIIFNFIGNLMTDDEDFGPSGLKFKLFYFGEEPCLTRSPIPISDAMLYFNE